ncbi:hypothetical protein LU11_gp171 [Pseudomonas phage Lu11]|uniref:hypothetical protein n=1 Tax=Pseudomonas phage Lu11 TaxID=1161927 RepID=UPI00025F17D1|nr:hypothetical protein LU11_gp171 [Pseudomonas phage Lu11]AFH14702.1 hypothetical protein Lu11_0167A [Pseudomonas phage Lu11]
MSVTRPRTTPCIGRCSHNVGDEICKGCKRTIAEVRDWNTYSPDEKMQKMEELKLRSSSLIATDKPIISWDD